MEFSSIQSFLKHEAETSDLPNNEIGTEGLQKRILQKGISWETPFPGDEIEVHYSGFIEGGAYFDSSREKGTPFKFKLAQCEVIKGWDEGVATMKKGERAIFTIPPNLAYGEVGSPPLIGSNATLIFDIEMLSWSSIRDITNDGGVLKKIIKEGEGWATPKNADQVLVKYEARHEDGTLVSKSDDGVEFHIDDGYLCPALSIAVKTMRKGEKAELSVKFSYGVGENVNAINRIDNDALCNSNLTIYLELVSWKSVTDVTGDKKVLKKIVKPGEGFDRPNEGSLVKVIYIGKLEDGTIFERKGSNEEPFEYMCFEEQINESLDSAIMTMKKGEQALVTIDKVPGIMDSVKPTLVYEVELIDFVKEKPFWKMDTLEKIEACERKKHDGNKLFKDGKFSHASKKYEKAAKYVEFEHTFTDEEKQQANILRISCILNNAACKLRTGECLEASKLCTKVLKLDPINVKALFRRSQAYLKTSELEKADADIKRALAIDPYNREVKLMYKELKDVQKEYTKHQAEIFGTMLSKMKINEKK